LQQSQLHCAVEHGRYAYNYLITIKEMKKYLALNIYGYDAYLIQCALQTNTALLTLDNGLIDAAGSAGVKCLEV
jgi:predicted nucleic acid-binding protein